MTRQAKRKPGPHDNAIGQDTPPSMPGGGDAPVLTEELESAFRAAPLGGRALQVDVREEVPGGGQEGADKAFQLPISPPATWTPGGSKKQQQQVDDDTSSEVSSSWLPELRLRVHGQKHRAPSPSSSLGHLRG